MDPVRQFKFACPVCGQHLQARVEEAGRTTECPSCFKKLTVPQAPTSGGSKLLITASLADTRRGPLSNHLGSGSRRIRRVPSKGPMVYLLFALLAGAVILGFLLAMRGEWASSRRNSGTLGLWTDDAQGLQLVDTPVVGRLKGWNFLPTTTFWKDTTLTLQQNGGRPEALRLEITFPLRGGDLISGKSFRVGPDDSPFETPIRILWKDKAGEVQRESVSSGYILWVRFDTVSSKTVEGRLHLCFSDAARSWVAGRFSAENRTRLK